jgi:hypothetical protein
LNLLGRNDKPQMRRSLAVVLVSYGPWPVPSGSVEIHRGKVSVATAWQRDGTQRPLAATSRASSLPLVPLEAEYSRDGFMSRRNTVPSTTFRSPNSFRVNAIMFKDEYREFQEIVKEVQSIRYHNLGFKQYDPSMLLMAEGALILLAFERFLRMILGNKASGKDVLANLLEKATSKKFDLIRLPGRLNRKKTIEAIAAVWNALARANYEQSAKDAGLKNKDDYFKSGVYLSQVETLFRILNRIIKQIDLETGQPHDRSRQEMKDFLASPDFVDLRKPALDERGPETPQETRDRRYMFADAPALAFSLPHWEEAMLSCFHFEVNVRLLAAKFYPAESVGTDIGDKKDKPGLLTKLFQRSKLAFSEKEKSFLPKCNTLRNKLIHCEPDAVRKMVKELMPAFQPPDKVQQFKVPVGASRAAIHDFLNARKGAVNVSATSSRQDGFFGWMLQASQDGTFDMAAGFFRFGIGVIKAKALLADG